MLRLIALLLRQRLVAQRLVNAGHAAPRRTALRAGGAALALGAATYGALPYVWRDLKVGAPSPHIAQAEPATLRMRVTGMPAAPLLAYLDRHAGDAAIAATAAVPPTVPLKSVASRFEPAFQIAPLGAQVQIGNADDVAHNTHLFQGADGRRRTLFNVALPQQGVAVTRVLTRAGLFEVRCDLHAWMRAAVFVPPNTHHLLVREAGDFVLRDIPPGRWQLHVWSAVHGERVQTIDLAPGTSKILDISAR